VFILIPHIVRSQELTDLNQRAIDVGTGNSLELRRVARPDLSHQQLGATKSGSAKAARHRHSTTATANQPPGAAATQAPANGQQQQGAPVQRFSCSRHLGSKSTVRLPHLRRTIRPCDALCDYEFASGSAQSLADRGSTSQLTCPWPAQRIVLSTGTDQLRPSLCNW